MQQWECWSGVPTEKDGKTLIVLKRGDETALEIDAFFEAEVKKIVDRLNDQEKLRELARRVLEAGERGQIQGLYGPLYGALRSLVSIERAAVDLKMLSPQVRAEVHSDDCVFEVSFLAAKWFAQASDAEIVALANSGWGRNLEADAVALFFEADNGSIATLMQYVHSTQDRRDPQGFECTVNADDAIHWARIHRPSIVKRLEKVQSSLSEV